MVTLNRWLIVRGNGEMRVTKIRPRLQWNEVAFRLQVKVATSWGQTAGLIELEIPEGTVAVTPEEIEKPEES